MFTLKRTFSIIVMVVFTLVACSPEDGETGPAGPIGPEGQIGPAGADGIDGKDGSANVKSYTFSVASGDWTANSATGLTYIEDTISVPEITQNIIDNGALLTYMKLNATSSTWLDMPFQDYVIYNNGTGNVFSVRTYQASYAPGFLNLRSFISSGVSFTTNPGIEVKLVLIPPSSRVAGLDYGNYKEVEMVYGLKD